MQKRGRRRSLSDNEVYPPKRRKKSSLLFCNNPKCEILLKNVGGDIICPSCNHSYCEGCKTKFCRTNGSCLSSARLGEKSLSMYDKVKQRKRTGATKKKRTKKQRTSSTAKVKLTVPRRRHKRKKVITPHASPKAAPRHVSMTYESKYEEVNLIAIIREIEMSPIEKKKKRQTSEVEVIEILSSSEDESDCEIIPLSPNVTPAKKLKKKERNDEHIGMKLAKMFAPRKNPKREKSKTGKKSKVYSLKEAKRLNIFEQTAKGKPPKKKSGKCVSEEKIKQRRHIYEEFKGLHKGALSYWKFKRIHGKRKRIRIKTGKFTKIIQYYYRNEVVAIKQHVIHDSFGRINDQIILCRTIRHEIRVYKAIQKTRNSGVYICPYYGHVLYSDKAQVIIGIVLKGYSMNLFEYLKRKDLPVKDLVKIAVKTAKCVVFVHGKGVLHMDIKLENIVMDNIDNLVLVDFDQSILLEDGEEVRALKTGDGLGTGEYVSPEKKDHWKACKKSDVFGFAVLLYHVFIPQNDPDFKKYNVDEFFNTMKESYKKGDISYIRRKMLEKLSEILTDVPKEVLEIIRENVIEDFEKRWTMKKIVRHLEKIRL